MYRGQKIIVVLPAYNAAATLERTVRDLPEMVDEIILVDDASQDATAARARISASLFFSTPKMPVTAPTRKPVTSSP